MEYWLRLFKINKEKVQQERILLFEKALHTLQKYMEAMMLAKPFQRLCQLYEDKSLKNVEKLLIRCENMATAFKDMKDILHRYLLFKRDIVKTEKQYLIQAKGEQIIRCVSKFREDHRLFQGPIILHG